MNPQVTERLKRYAQWQPEMAKLRAIVLECGLTEELKWEEACYTFNGANILVLHGFKEYCALLFFKGVLMKDPAHILIQQTEHVQAGRQIRFTDLEEINQQEAMLKAYIAEAIAVEKSGAKIDHKKTEDYEVPDELRAAFQADPAFQHAFEALTPGRQRGYLLYFAAPKQSKTRAARIEKSMGLIFDGLGLQDEYRQSRES